MIFAAHSHHYQRTITSHDTSRSRHEPCKRSPTLVQKWFESKVMNNVRVEGLGTLLGYPVVMFLRDTNVLVNAQNLDRDHAANQVVEQGLQHQAHVPTASSLSVNESRPRSGQSTPTPSHEPFSYHKCISRTQAVRPSTGPRGTLPFRTTRGRRPPLLRLLLALLETVIRPLVLLLVELKGD